MIGPVADGTDILKGDLAGASVPAAGIQQTEKLFFYDFFAEMLTYVGRIDLDGYDVVFTDGFGGYMDVGPGGDRDFTQMGDFLYDIDFPVQRLAAAVVYQAEGLHQPFLVFDLKFLGHSRRY